MTRSANPLRRRLALSTALGATLGVFASPAMAQVQGSFGTVTGTSTNDTALPGVQAPQPTFQITMETGTAGERLDVDLNARNTVINWSAFNIAAGPSAAQTKVVSFNNGFIPVVGANSTDPRAVLNVITQATPSEINGIVTTGTRAGTLAPGAVTPGSTNIQVWFVNGNGILLGPGANINTGGLVLSALALDATNVEAFRTTAAGGTYTVQFANALGSTSAITSGAGAPAVINTSNGLLALIAPQVNVNANTNSGTGATAYALATDVTLATQPGGPLSITINAGTSLGAQVVSGAIVADRLYALVTPQAGVDALLNMSGATVNNASVNPEGVVILGTNAVFAVADTTLTNGVNAANSSVSIDLGAINLQTPILGTPTTAAASLVVDGRSSATAGGNITARALSVGGTARLRTNLGAPAPVGTVSLTGVTSAGTLLLTGANVAVTAGATAVTVGGDIILDAVAGPVTIASAATLTGNTSAQAGRVFQVGGDATTGLNLTGSSLVANAAGTAGVRFTTAAAGDDFLIGNVTAAQLSGKVGAAGATPGVTTRTGVIGFGNVALTGAGANTITASGSTDTLDLAAVTAAGSLTLNAGAGGVTFTSIGGPGAKTVTANVTSTTGIDGGAITGAGAVSLTAAADTPIEIASLGTDAANRLGALTIDGGNGVTIGAAGATGTTAFLTSANIGENAGAPVQSLTINGGTDHSGAFTSTTTNGTALGAVVSGGAFVSEAGAAGASFGALSGAGTKLVVTSGSIGATSIRGAGAVTLTGGIGATEGVTVAGGVGASGAAVDELRVDGGNASLGALFVTNAALLGQGVGLNRLVVTGAVDTGSLISDTNSVATTPLGTEFQGTVRARNGAIDVVSASAIEFDGAVDGVAGLTVQAAGGSSTTFRGAVGSVSPFTSFTSVGTAPVNLNGGTLATSGSQSYGGSLVLGANTTLSGSGATFTGGVTGGGFDLALNFSGAQTLTGATFAGVRNLSTDAAGSTTLNGTFSTTGTQTFNDAVTLSGPVQLTSTGAGAAGNIRFGGTLDGANALAATTAGTISFAGVVGGITPLTTINTTGAAATAIQTAGVTTTGAQTYGATSLNGAVDVTLDAGAAPVSFTGLNGPGGLAVNTTGLTTLPGGGSALAFINTNAGGTTSVSGTLTTTGAQAYGDQLTLTAATTLAGTQAIFNGGVVGGGFDLTLNTSGAQALGATVTGVGALTTDAAGTLTLNGDLTTSGAQTFNDATTLGASVQLSAGANLITFGSTLNSTSELHQLFVVGSPVAFNGDVGGGAGGGTRLAALTTGGTTSIGGAGTRTIRTVGTQNYGGALTLNTDAVLVGSGAIFGGAIDGTAGNRDLTLTFANANTLPAGAFVNIGDLLVNGAGATTLNGNVTTVGGQSYVSALTLGAASVLTSTGGGAISFGSLTGGGFGLTVNTAGVTTFNNGAGAFASIATDAPGITTLNGLLDTTGLQNYADNVVLGSSTTVQSSGGGALTFGGTVTGAQDLLVATVGITTFAGAVSTNSLSSTAAGAVQLNGGSVTTTAAQAYAGQLRLGADTVLTGTTGTFGGGVLGNGNDLALNFSGATVIDGGLAGIDNLSTGGGGTTTLSGIIDTLGGQNYADAVTLGAATVLRSGGGTGTGAIGFGSTLDGAQALTVTTGGTTSFAGAVGGATPLTSLTVDGTGAIAIDGGAVTTTGVQSYAGATTLLSDLLLATNGGNVSFASTVGGPVQLSIRTGPAATPVAGTVSLGGAVSVNALAIRANAATASSAANDVGTLAALVNTGGFALADLNALTVGTVDGLSGIATGTGALSLSAGGLLTLAATTGAGATALTGVGITQNAGTTVNAGAGTITLDAQDGGLALSGTLTTTNGTANAVRLLDAGAVQLGTIQAGSGTVTLGGAAGDNLAGAVTQVGGSSVAAGTLIGTIGGAAALTNVNAIGTLGAFTASSLSLRNAGALAVTGPVSSGGALTLDIDAGNLSLNGNLTAAGTTTLVVDAGGIVQAAGSVLTTPVLTGSAAQAVSLTGANLIGTLAGFTVAAGGFALNNAQALAISQDVSVAGPLSIAALGIDFTGRTLAATGAATLNGQAGAVVGATLTAGGNATVTGNTVAIGSASAGASPSGTLSVTAQNGLTLGSGTAGQAIALSTTNGALTATTLTASNTGSVTAITASAGGAATIGTAISNNGAITITGGSADVTSATATNGALGITATGGLLRLGTGNAGTSATLTATGPLTVTTALTSNGAAQATATGVATVEAITSNNASALVRGSSAAVTTAGAATTLQIDATSGNASLVTGSAGGNAGVVASGGVMIGTLGTLATPVGGSVTIAANGGDAIVGTAVATGAASLTASGLAQAGTLNGSSVTGAGGSVDITTTTSSSTLDLAATSGALRLGTGTAAGAATLTAATTLDATTLTATGQATASSGGATTIDAITGSGVSVTGQSVTVRQAAATGGNLAIRGLGGAVSLTTGTATGTASLQADTGPLTIVTSLDATGNIALLAGQAITAGAVTSSGGAIAAQGLSASIARADAFTTLDVTATGGDVMLPTGIAGGNATIGATGSVALTTLSSGGIANVTATTGDVTGTSVTATGAASASAGNLLRLTTFNGAGVTGTGATIDVTNSASTGALAFTASGGPLTLGTGSATGGTATLSATGPLTVATSLTSSGNASATSTGGTATINTIASTGGSVAVAAQAVAVTGATAVQGLTLTANAGGLTLGTGSVTSGAATLAATGPLAITTSLTSSGNASATSTGGPATINTIASTGGNVAVTARSIDATRATAAQALALTANAGGLTLGTGIATAGTATLNAAGPLAITTSLSSGGTASATATGAATIAAITSTAGSVAVGAQSATVTTATANQALTLASTGGALSLGTGVATNGAATLTAAGPLAITGSLTSAGTASATATGAATIASITSNTGNVGVSAQSATVTTAAANQALALTSTGGGLTLGTGTATNGAATLTAAGPLAVTTRVTANGNASATATGPATIAAITSNTGSVAVSGTATSVTAATARTTLDLTATAGDLTMSTGTAGAAATLRATGAVASTSLTTTGGGAASLTAGTTLNSGTLNAAGAAMLVATGAATLGQTTSGAAIAVTAASIGAGQTVAGTTLAMTSAGNLTLAGATAGGNATFDAGGTAALGQVIAGATATIAIRALDAAITGIQRAATVSFTNRAPTTTTTKLGDGTSTGGGFALSATEVNLVEAGQLTVDAGAGNVEIGTLAFDADAGRTRADVLATGRIDVTGGVSGTGANRTFRFGGTAASTDAKASVIRVTAVVATPGAENTGGRLLFDTADLDLRGSRIGVGQAGGFLDPIGFGNATGLSAADVGAQFIGNPNSSLYNATFGGSPYAPDTTLVSARSLTVRYTSYALFQNTGAPGLNAGVALGTAAAGPQPNALVVQGPGSGTTNAFAFFGTIGGISNTSTAVLGSNVISATGTDAANTRINGCLVGSGAGCLTAVVSQPLLAIFDSSRLVIFQVGDDLVVPFDPVIGTNNEALFSGIGVIGADGGVIDDGVSDTECTPDSTNPACGQAKEQGK